MENRINRKPDKMFRCGAVKEAVWADSRVVDNTVVKAHSIRIDRAYKDKDTNEWKYTNTFNAEDLPKVAVVAMEAYKWIRLRTSEESNNNTIGADQGIDES